MPVYYLHEPEPDWPMPVGFKTQKSIQPLDNLAMLIEHAQKQNGCINPQEHLDKLMD